MKQKKEFRYHLKKDVRDDLEYLNHKINMLLSRDSSSGFELYRYWNILPALYKVYTHLLWNRTFETWFKKVYE